MIKKAKYLYDYLIEVTFYDNSIRVVDLEDFFKTAKNPLVRKHAPLNRFKKFHVDTEIGALCWGDNECDINPHNIYEGKYDAKLELV
jgi:hypothetical protein